jgi:hypothetical protein
MKKKRARINPKFQFFIQLEDSQAIL